MLVLCVCRLFGKSVRGLPLTTCDGRALHLSVSLLDHKYATDSSLWRWALQVTGDGRRVTQDQDLLGLLLWQRVRIGVQSHPSYNTLETLPATQQKGIDADRGRYPLRTQTRSQMESTRQQATEPL